ncbi:MAG: 4Fe-4S binding protein [Candidatus Omnitrophica bacterium]|nr:4Fe-4S binding protein [Candidatus Omnitrophota bacterium]
MPKDFNIAIRKRTIKQLLVAPFFLIILVGGWFYPLLGFFIPLCMLAGLGLALFRGRKWCDWYCPRGSFYDSAMKRLSPQQEIPWLFKNIKFRIAVLVFLISVMFFNLILRWPDAQKIGKFFVILITTTSILGIILAFMFHQRSWCSFCPIGTVISLISKNVYPLKIDSTLCIGCGVCYKVCPMQMKPLKDGDCLKCNLCISACPKLALTRSRK